MMAEKISLLEDLSKAQDLLSNVYSYACINNMGSLERLMSVADSCIIDARETLNKGGSGE